MLNQNINLSTLDIQQARIKFILFKSKLRAILYGGTADETLFSPRDNALGQWLYNSALQKYGHIPEIRELERVHLNIIRQGQELWNMYRRGQIEEARSGLSRLDANEEELTRLLGAVSKKVA